MVKRILVFLSFFSLLYLPPLVRAVDYNKIPTVPVVESIDYALPYPGILPDNPLYVLKVARDRLMGWAIQNSLSKPFFLLLLSDKRLLAGEMLINEKKAQLGVETILRGEEYFTEAVNAAEAAKRKKRHVNDLLAKLVVSAAKHEEVINSLLSKTSGEDLKQLRKAYEENQKSKSRVIEVMVGK